MMDFPITEVSKIAIQEILSQSKKGEGPGELSIDMGRMPEAEYYGDIALEELKDEYGYDPAEKKTKRAKPAIVRYIKVSLLGQSGSLDKRFTALADKWAKAVNRQENQADRDSKDDEYKSRRIDLYDTIE